MYEEYYSLPITNFTGVGDWADLKIIECGEELLRLTRPTNEIMFTAEYLRRGYKYALKDTFVRKSVLLRLREAVQLLPPEHKILIFDAWRPLSLQQEIYHQLKKKIRHKNPKYTEAQLNSVTNKYVTFPSDDPSNPHPHLTGGAVDLTICDGDNNPIPMGTEFDYFGPESRTLYYEELLESRKVLSPEERIFLQNRRLIYHVLTAAGFTNLSEEWWHYDYGNQFWASIKGQNAIYGPVANERSVNE
jgi:zinc D-Ala-D-Ala dipeptidase